jgi:hypothetical protein
MDVFATSFRGISPDASVLLDTELRGGGLASTPRERVDVSYIVIDATGKTHDAQTYPVTITPDPALRARLAHSGIRLLNRLSLAPGQYELRVAARDEANGRIGSVVYTLDVPDFSASPVALSGVVLTSALGTFTLTPHPDDTLRSALPGPPVALRAFPQNDTVVLYGEAYDNGPAPPQKVDVVVTVMDGNGGVIFTAATERDPSIVRDRAGTYRFTARVPMKGLPVGSYTLTIAAQSDLDHIASAIRRVPFTVVPAAATPPS